MSFAKGLTQNHAFQDKPMDTQHAVKNTRSDQELVETSDNRTLRGGAVLAQLAEFLFLYDRPSAGVPKAGPRPWQ